MKKFNIIIIINGGKLLFIHRTDQLELKNLILFLIFIAAAFNRFKKNKIPMNKNNLHKLNIKNKILSILRINLQITVF